MGGSVADWRADARAPGGRVSGRAAVDRCIVYRCLGGHGGVYRECRGGKYRWPAVVRIGDTWSPAGEPLAGATTGKPRDRRYVTFTIAKIDRLRILDVSTRRRDGVRGGAGRARKRCGWKSGTTSLLHSRPATAAAAAAPRPRDGREQKTKKLFGSKLAARRARRRDKEPRALSPPFFLRLRGRQNNREKGSPARYDARKKKYCGYIVSQKQRAK